MLQTKVNGLLHNRLPLITILIYVMWLYLLMLKQEQNVHNYYDFLHNTVTSKQHS